MGFEWYEHFSSQMVFRGQRLNPKHFEVEYLENDRDREIFFKEVK